MKKIFSMILTVCVLLAMSLSIQASEVLPLFDEPDLMTDAQEASLAAKLERISEQYQMEVVVAAFETIDGASPMEYADDFYDYNGYGYGENRDGLILIVVMDSRDWWISTRGSAITAFTDAGIEYIGDQIVPYMSADDFAGAFNAFADQCSMFMAQAATGDPYDVHNLPQPPKEPFNAGMAVVIAIAVGFIIGKIYADGLKGQLKSVSAQKSAESYVKRGSMNVTTSRDFYLYRSVTKTAKPSDSSEGGSSTHTSSSGATHGGGGGKF